MPQRTFACRITEFGVDVVDDQGTRWAGFDVGQPEAACLGEAFATMATKAYALGADDTHGSSEGGLRLARSHGRDGRPTWDLRSVGDAGPSIAELDRSILGLGPSSLARAMLSCAQGVYAVGRADRETLPTRAP